MGERLSSYRLDGVSRRERMRDYESRLNPTGTVQQPKTPSLAGEA